MKSLVIFQILCCFVSLIGLLHASQEIQQENSENNDLEESQRNFKKFDESNNNLAYTQLLRNNFDKSQINPKNISEKVLDVSDKVLKQSFEDEEKGKNQHQNKAFSDMSLGEIFGIFFSDYSINFVKYIILFESNQNPEQKNGMFFIPSSGIYAMRLNLTQISDFILGQKSAALNNHLFAFFTRLNFEMRFTLTFFRKICKNITNQNPFFEKFCHFLKILIVSGIEEKQYLTNENILILYSYLKMKRRLKIDFLPEDLTFIRQVCFKKFELKYVEKSLEILAKKIQNFFAKVSAELLKSQVTTFYPNHNAPSANLPLKVDNSKAKKWYNRLVFWR